MNIILSIARCYPFQDQKAWEWAADMLGVEGKVPDWKFNNLTIQKSTFSPLVRNWVSFVLGTLKSRKNDDEITLLLATLTATIIKKLPINVGKAMRADILSACKKNKKV